MNVKTDIRIRRNYVYYPYRASVYIDGRTAFTCVFGWLWTARLWCWFKSRSAKRLAKNSKKLERINQ